MQCRPHFDNYLAFPVQTLLTNTPHDIHDETDDTVAFGGQLKSVARIWLANMKCHRTGRTVYPMDNPIKIDTGAGTLVFSRGGFTCELLRR